MTDIRRDGWKMTNLTLIGWHGFNAEDISIAPDGVTLIIADNGVGKSSTLDAITTVLTGGDSGSNRVPFNALAQNKQSDRTIPSYMLGALGENKFRRKSSHTWLALSFRHSANSKKVASAIVYMYTDEETYHINPRKLITKKIAIVEDIVSKRDFIHNDKILSFDEWLDITSCNKDNMLIYDKPGEYKQKLLQIIGPLGNKRTMDENFYTNLKTMMEKRTISNIDDFLKNSLLKKPDININEMQNDIKMVEQFQNDIYACKTLIKDIQNVIDNGNKLQEIINLINESEEQKKYAEVYNLFASLEKGKKSYEENQNKLNESEIILLDLQQILLHKTQARDEAKLAVNQNSNEAQLKEANLKLQLLESQYHNKNEKKEQILDQSKKISQAVFALFNKSYPFDNKDDIIKLNKFIDDKEDSILDFQTVEDKIGLFENDLLDKKNRLSVLRKEKDNLDSSQRYPDRNAENLMTALNTKGIKGHYLYELVSNVQDEWRLATESVLGANRSAIIVAEKDYEDALKILRRSNIRRAQIINPKIKWEKQFSIENSLFDKITCNEQTAEAFIRSKTGNIYCAKTEKELTEHKNAISQKAIGQSLTRVSGWSAFNIEALEVSKYLLTKISPEECADERKRLNILITTVKEEIETLESNLKLLKTNKQYSELLIHYIDNFNDETLNIFDDLYMIFNEKEQLIEQIDELKKDQSYQELIDILTLKEQEVKTTNDKVIQLTQDIGGIKNNLKNIHDRINNIEKVYKLKIKEIGLDIDIQYDWNNFNIPEEAKKDYNLFEKSQNNKITHLGELRSQYIGSWNRSYENALQHHAGNPDVTAWELFQIGSGLDNIEPTIEKMKQFIENQLLTNMLDYENNLNDWQDKLIYNFKEGYVSRAFAALRDNDLTFKRLNAATSNMLYHGAEYKFERKIKGGYYENIYKFVTETCNAGGMFASENQDDILQTVIQYLKESGTDALEMLDPRNWYDYDIMIKPKNENLAITTVSKRAKTGSGGEIAAPYYVAVCASLMITSYPDPKHAGGLCLALFDESFEKLDTEVIYEIFKMFKESGIQVILCDQGKNVALSILSKQIIHIYKDGMNMNLFVEATRIGEKTVEAFFKENPALIGQKAWIEKEHKKNQGSLF